MHQAKLPTQFYKTTTGQLNYPTISVINTPLLLPLLRTIFLFIVLFVITNIAQAGQAILTWSPNTESDLAGYKVYYGTSSGKYNPPLDVGNVTTYTLNNLSDTSTYYFAVTAYDTSGNESGYSNEVLKTILDSTPPVISGVTTSTITTTGATVTWTTNEAATSQVEYGTTTSYGSSTSMNSNLVTSHSVNLSGLSPWTTYHFKVKGQDAAGNLSVSTDYTFVTLAPPDSTPPTGTISINNGASYTTSATVTLTLSCNDTGTACDQMQLSNDSTTWNSWENYTDSKTWVLSNGDGDKTVYVRYKDKTGDTSQDYTDQITLDTATPVVSGVTINNITTGEATITWTTDEIATSQVEYGTDTLYRNSSNLDQSLVTSHTVTLSGLTPNTVYYFRVLSLDQAGNQGIAAGYNFTTMKVAQSDIPAAIADLRIRPGFSNKNTVTLDWTATGSDGAEGTATMYDLRVSTQKIIGDGVTPAEGEINFSNATKVTGLPAPKSAGTSESFQVSQLETNSVYYFAVKAKDDKGNLSAISNVVNGDNVPPLPVTAIRKGYTMISFPLVPVTSDVQTLLGGITGNTAELYWWSSSGIGDNTGTFVSENNVVPGYGYFLKSNIDTAVLNIAGTVINDASRAIPLQPGWNIVGNPYHKEIYLRNTYIRKADTGELKNYEDAVIAGWVGNAIYNYNGSTYGFELYADAKLNLWQGYWIAVLHNGQYEMLIYKP